MGCLLQTVHSCVLKPTQMSWYTERSLTDLSLGGLLILVVIRYQQHLLPLILVVIRYQQHLLLLILVVIKYQQHL